MSAQRELILNKIRDGLGRSALDSGARARLLRRLQNPPRNLIPARSSLDHQGLMDLFVAMAEEAGASVDHVATAEDIPGAVGTFLSSAPGVSELVMGDNPVLNKLVWSSSWSIVHRPARKGDRVAISTAFAGIAETGTLLLISGPENPTTLNFLPDNHLVVLSAARIVGPYEDAWDLLRQELNGLPRTVNLITGPSRSADIEQKVQMGAHGPIRLHVLLVAGL